MNGTTEDTRIHFTKIRVENTNLCKYTCEMCPREKMTRPLGIMSPEDYQIVLDCLKEYINEVNLPQPYACTFYLHGYGEPLFDPMLVKKSAMVAEQFPASQSLIYTTLGVRRPESYLKNLLITGRLRNMIVSLYGFQEATYSAIHQGGNFSTVKENIIRLATLNNSLGKPCNIRVQLLAPYTFDIIRKDYEENRAFLELMSILEPLGVTLLEMNIHNFGDGRNYGDPNADTSVCSIVSGLRQAHLNVSCDLKVLPCCFDYNADIVFGDLRDQSIYEIYHGVEYNKFIDAHRVGNLDDYHLCKGCDKR